MLTHANSARCKVIITHPANEVRFASLRFGQWPSASMDQAALALIKAVQNLAFVKDNTNVYETS